MADQTLTINNADGSSKTFTINRDKFAGVSSMQVNGQTVTVDRTAVPKEQDRETTFGGTQSITVKRDIDPLLNKVVGGAAAAYSLRDLNDKQGNNKVARVRRGDNAEKDFLGKEIDKVADWVNGKQDTTLPCDVASAAAAYSLRSVNSNYTGNIVRVRRSSDNTEQDFSDVSLIADWVNEDVVTYQSNFTTTDNWTVISNYFNATLEDNIGGLDTVIGFDLSSSNSGRFGLKKSGLNLASGEQYTLTFKYFTDDTSYGGMYWNIGNPFDSINFVSSSTNDEIIADGIWRQVTLLFNNDAVDLRLKITSSSGATLGALNSNLSGKIYLRDVVLTTTSANGFVTTWYDQSGNGNNATQSTASSQPKIVDAGVYLGELDFDGVDDKLVKTSFEQGELSQPNSIFSVNSMVRNIDYTYDGTSDTKRHVLFQRDGNFRMFAGTDAGIAPSDGNVHLFLNVFNQTTSDAYIDGTLKVSSVNVGAHPIGGITIGARYVSNFGQCSISEIIIYNSDQSANRFKIESNINNHYGLYTNANDGFVTSWYDQSGNSNDATQSVAASQPKIVDGGVYLGELDFDGVDDFLETNNSDLCNLTELSLFTVLTPFIGESEKSAVSAGSFVFNSTGYGGWVLNFKSLNTTAFQTQSQGNVSITSASQNVSASESLVTALLNVPNATTSVNGAEGTTNTSMLEPFNNNTERRKLRIGCKFTFQSSSYYSKPIKEVILYDSDQSANRAAIETNINNYYDIY